ncbi:MarR family transcriptional regulator [Myxococcaceae bacterium JPH2]|nr:MarR family transcriptional regulator [Myxococcaceae bacterium JPH2]
MQQLKAAEQRLVEAMGLHFESQGATRIAGRIHGLLMLADEPLSLDRIGRLLKVSPASVSTNIRQCLAAGLVEPVSVPGDRKHYYVISTQGWETRMRSAEESLKRFIRLCKEALENPALGDKPHVREAYDFGEFYLAEMAGISERWRATRGKASKGRTS